MTNIAGDKLAAREMMPWIVRLSAPKRLGIVLAVSSVLYFVLAAWMSASTRVLLTWDVGVSTYLALASFTIARSDATMTQLRCRLYDQSGYIIFLMIVTAACASVVAIGFVLGEIKSLPFWPKTAHLALSITALMLSWLLIHTLFAFHYARKYYGTGQEESPGAGGLKFPGGDDPDYLDFAYYSFVVGMTSQVSDVSITSRHMRRETMIHGILSFVFNIAIFAMSINIISGIL